MALDQDAVRRANERLWTAHPTLNRRQLTREPEDVALRREWMAYYREETPAPPDPPEPRVRPAALPAELAPELPSPVLGCERKCKDESARICPCCQLTTITFYVQKGDSPATIVADSLGDLLKRQDMQPDTGHTFIGIGDGDLSEQQAYGFYPATSWLGETGGINANDGFYFPGQDEPRTDIYDPENVHPYSHKRSYKACPDAVSQLKSLIERDIELIKANDDDAPGYNLTNLQCTTWARRYLDRVGFEDPGGFSPHGAATSLEGAAKAGKEKEAAGKKLSPTK